MGKPAINACFISDIHLGHRRNSTLGIVKNLKSAVGDNVRTSQFDIIFLAGDVFDSLLNLSQDETLAIDGWIRHLLHVCVKYDIVLRILRGTQSHDFRQSKRFIEVNEIWQIGADVKFIETVSVEYIPQIDRHVLYVPDEATDSTDKTLALARAAMAAMGVTQVDIGVMHGQFDYQVPPQANVPKHDSAAYLEMVREIISIGHDHHFSQHGHIVAQGSFDRLSHGEEEPKGHVEARLTGDGPALIEFVENKNALKFITVDCQGLSAEDSFAKIAQSTADLPEHSWVRLKIEAKHPLAIEPVMVMRKFPQFRWSRFKIVKEDSQAEELEQAAPAVFEAITITPENITDLLMARMARHSPSPVVMDHMRMIMEEIR